MLLFLDFLLFFAVAGLYAFGLYLAFALAPYLLGAVLSLFPEPAKVEENFKEITKRGEARIITPYEPSGYEYRAPLLSIDDETNCATFEVERGRVEESDGEG